MSYHRGEPYVFDDDVFVHIWSNLREGDTGYASGVRIDLRVFDEIVVKRFAHLVEEGRVPFAIEGAARKLGSGIREEMMKALAKESRIKE